MESNNEQEALYRKGIGLRGAGNTDEALQIFEELAAQGDFDAMICAGEILLQKEEPEADKKAFKYLLEAGKHTTSAYDHLCVCYGYGLGVKRNMPEAVRYANLALEHTPEEDINPGVYLILGNCYANGEGAIKDVCKAYRYLKMAEEQGLEEEAKSQLDVLCARYPFTEDGEIDLSVRKRSKWATFFAWVGILSSAFLSVMITLGSNEYGAALIGACLVVAYVLLLFWKKWGVYMLVGILVLAYMALICSGDNDSLNAMLWVVSRNTFWVIMILLLLQKRRTGYALAWNSLMGKRDDGRNSFRKFMDKFLQYGTGPEYSPESPQSKRLRIACYILTVLAGVLAIWSAIGIVRQEWEVVVEWNCFKNEGLLGFLAVVGFFLQFLPKMWQHTSYDTYIEYEDQYGNKKREKDYDVLTVTEGSLLMPLLSHFVLIPLIYGIMLYYLLMAGFAVLQSVMPYIIGALVLASVWMVYRLFVKTFARKYRVGLVGLIVWVFVHCYGGIIVLTDVGIPFSFGNSDIMSEKLEKRPFQKIVKVEDNVNLRKAPDAKSARLELYLYDYYEPELGWSDNPKSNRSKPARAKYLAVLGEAGDWYRAAYYLPDVGQCIVYVKKEFCKNVGQRALNFPAPEHEGQFHEITQGKYKGILLNWKLGMFDTQEFRIGKKYGDCIVYGYMCNFSRDDREDGLSRIEKINAVFGCKLYFDSKFFTEVAPYTFNLDLKKLASDKEVMDLIMSNLDHMDITDEYVYAVEGESDWFYLEWVD